MKLRLTLLLVLFNLVLFGQDIDTITFHSEAFGTDRTIYVHTPDFYKYQSDEVKLPVFYVLDGQHEWFAEPVLTNIKYLQYTKEIPSAITVVIPIGNRFKELGIPKNRSEVLPLHIFITEEISNMIEKYRPSDYRLIVGHSFGASFSLYSYGLKPDFYAAILANTPLDKMKWLVPHLDSLDLDKSKIYLSIGSNNKTKDMYHREVYDEMKAAYPKFFEEINTYEADFATHNSVPIIAVPKFLNEIFFDYSVRYENVATVDLNYKLVNKPKSVEEELQLIEKATSVNGYYIYPELPEINGLASRYYGSEYVDHALKIFELGAKLYDKDFEFQLTLADFYLKTDKEKAKSCFEKAIALLNTVDKDLEDQDEIVKEIEDMMLENGMKE